MTTIEQSPTRVASPHLRALESEAIHILREVAGQFDKPVILFSAGKDSVLVLHLALKAFYPAPLPFSLLHVDTGHNFSEVIEFRDRRLDEHGHKLIVGHLRSLAFRGPEAEASPLSPLARADRLMVVHPVLVERNTS